VRPRGPAPKLGEHTRTVLTELGYPESEAQRLFDAKIVA